MNMIIGDPQALRALIIRGVLALLVILVLSLPFLQNIAT